MAEEESDDYCYACMGVLDDLQSIVCDDAITVVHASPPGRNQNYEPFEVAGLGTWKTQDQVDAGQQPYVSADGAMMFMWYMPSSVRQYPHADPPWEECGPPPRSSEPGDPGFPVDG